MPQQICTKVVPSILIKIWFAGTSWSPDHLDVYTFQTTTRLIDLQDLNGICSPDDWCIFAYCECHYKLKPSFKCRNMYYRGRHSGPSSALRSPTRTQLQNHDRARKQYDISEEWFLEDGAKNVSSCLPRESTFNLLSVISKFEALDAMGSSYRHTSMQRTRKPEQDRSISPRTRNEPKSGQQYGAAFNTRDGSRSRAMTVKQNYGPFSLSPSSRPKNILGTKQTPSRQYSRQYTAVDSSKFSLPPSGLFSPRPNAARTLEKSWTVSDLLPHRRNQTRSVRDMIGLFDVCKSFLPT